MRPAAPSGDGAAGRDLKDHLTTHTTRKDNVKKNRLILALGLIGLGSAAVAAPRWNSLATCAPAWA